STAAPRTRTTPNVSRSSTSSSADSSRSEPSDDASIVTPRSESNSSLLSTLLLLIDEDGTLDLELERNSTVASDGHHEIEIPGCALHEQSATYHSPADSRIQFFAPASDFWGARRGREKAISWAQPCTNVTRQSDRTSWRRCLGGSDWTKISAMVSGSCRRCCRSRPTATW